MKFIPQIQPWIDDSELEEIRKVIESTYITEFDKTKEFEDRFRELTGAKHAIAYCNGTMSLLASLLILELKPGDEVIVPDLTFIATANPILLAGGTPVFCDIEEEGWQIDPKKLEEKITEKTRAIIPVHLYGFAANIEAIMEIAKRHNLFVLEDAAESLGVTVNEKHVGTFGDIGMISFYANKTITTAEGAIILTNDDHLAKRLYQMKNHGRSSTGTFFHETVGYNFRFSDVHAAIGVAQLNKLPKILKRKWELYDKYKAELSDIQEVTFPSIPEGTYPSHWFINIHVPDAAALEEFLKEQGIQSRRLFFPMHNQGCYEGKYGSDTDFPNTMKAYETGLSLPSSVILTEEEQDYVISKIREFLQ